MEEALSCVICCERYTLTAHLPMTLRCGHTFCRACLDLWFEEKARIQCPLDEEMFYDEVDSLPRNHTIVQMLNSFEVRCPAHLEVKISHFCISHLEGICNQCPHQSDYSCVVKEVALNLAEVSTAVYSGINTTRAKVSALQPNTKARIDSMYTQSLSDNLRLLYDLKALVTVEKELQCAACGSSDRLNFLQREMQCYCRSCAAIYRSDTFIDLSGKPPAMIVALFAEYLPQLLKGVNFSDLNYNQLYYAYYFPQQTPQVALSLLQSIKQLAAPRANFYSVPDTFYCPSCYQQLQKATCAMRVLPCAALHAICENCAQALSNQTTVICPLDKVSYCCSPTELETLQPPPEPQRNMPEYHQLSPRRTGPESTPLPIPPVPHCYLNRFESVLPYFGAPSDLSREADGWYVHYEKNQVEVLTFTVSEEVVIIGLALGNPVDQVSTAVEFISIFQGSGARGEPLFRHANSDLLTGGTQISTDIYFRFGFPINANRQYALKLKFIQTDMRFRNIVRLFRGNSYMRPDICMGCDNSIWEFEHSGVIDPKEFVSGQNNLSGPILRMYYLKGTQTSGVSGKD